MTERSQSRGRLSVARIRFTLTALLTIVLAWTTVAFAQSADPTNLRIRWWQDIVDLDPPQIRDSLATEVAYKIYSTLVAVRSGTFDEIVPDLATHWEIGEDGLSYTFHLRDNATWHLDYGAVTAHDVVWSLMRHKDAEVASSFSAEATFIENVEALDDHTVRITLSQPYPGLLLEFLAYRPGFIVNRQAIEDAGSNYTERPIGSGPFVFESWTPREAVVLVRNDDYYGNAGPFERVTYVQIPEEAVAEIAIERGDIDIAYFLDADVQNRIAQHGRIESVTIPAPRTFYVQLNTERAPFDDVRVRQALWFALDKDLIVEGALAGQGSATDTMLNAYVFGRTDATTYSYDPDRAVELLTEAGYASGFEATLLIYPPYGIPNMAAAMQDMWRQVGINVEIVQREWAQHVELRRNGEFDLALQPILRLGPDQTLSQTIHSASIPYPNATRYASPEMDALLEAARVEPDDAARRDLYILAQALAQVDVPVIPLLNPTFVLAYQPNLGNLKPGLLTINLTELTVDSD